MCRRNGIICVTGPPTGSYAASKPLQHGQRHVLGNGMCPVSAIIIWAALWGRTYFPVIVDVRRLRKGKHSTFIPRGCRHTIVSSQTIRAAKILHRNLTELSKRTWRRSKLDDALQGRRSDCTQLSAIGVSCT